MASIPRRHGPLPFPREHDSDRGFYQHYHNREDPCPGCRKANREAQRDRYAAKKAAQAARRERWRQQDQERQRAAIDARNNESRQEAGTTTREDSKQ